MNRRLKAVLLGLLQAACLAYGYIWLGGVYKLSYALSHDVSRLKTKLPQLPYYQQQFLLDSLLQQTWVYGNDFSEFVGPLPSLAALFGANPAGALADYCAARTTQLSEFPSRHPGSIYSDAALDAGYQYARAAAFLGLLGARTQPSRAVARPIGGRWRPVGLPDFASAAALSGRLADEYPESVLAPGALARRAEGQMDAGRLKDGLKLFTRVGQEYPNSAEAERAANALYAGAAAAGNYPQMREFRERAVRAAAASGRELSATGRLSSASSVAILGYQVDLSEIQLRLRQVFEATEHAALARSEIARLSGLEELNDDARSELETASRRASRVGDHLWVERLFKRLELPVPGEPPAPPAGTVTGRVTLGTKPLPEIEVALAQRNTFARSGSDALSILRSIPFRGRTDRVGRYVIRGVPAGEYRPLLLFDTLKNGRPIVPNSTVSPMIRVEPGNQELPDTRFEFALKTRSYGELNADGGEVSLTWDPEPGAATYEVGVYAAPEMFGAFRRRFRSVGFQAMRRRRFALWQSARVSGTSAGCPVGALAPDDARVAPLVSYEYVVRALNSEGVVLLESARPLSRFTLGAAARVEMLARARRGQKQNRGTP